LANKRIASEIVFVNGFFAEFRLKAVKVALPRTFLGQIKELAAEVVR
jgi:hypothetical protein